MRYNKRLSFIHDIQGTIDHTEKINPNQNVPTLIPLDRPRMY